MPEIVADPPLSSCYHLFSGPRIQEHQQLAPDSLSPRARRARALREGKLRQSAGAAARHPQSQAAGARSCRSAAERAGAVGAARPQASSVAAPRRAALAAAARAYQPGRASPDQPVVVADGRGCSTGAIHCSDGHCPRRDHARRGRAYRRAGRSSAAPGPAPRTTGAPAGASIASGPDPGRIGYLLLLAYSAAPRRCEKPCSWLVMNSSNAARPSSVWRRARRIASPICAGSSTRSLQPPRSRAMLA